MIIQPENLQEFCQLNCYKHDVNSIQEAYSFVKSMATGHYENFIVGSILIPKKISKYFYSIYAFARVGDDIADELTKVADINSAAELLSQYEESLYFLYNSEVKIHANNPIFVALKDTIEYNNIDIAPFLKLISAFRSDIYFSPPTTFEDLFDYCSNSANPVGELILTLFQENNSQALHYSDCICTALQLINFWQDISIDLRRNRCYIPSNLFDKTLVSNDYYQYFAKIEAADLQKILEKCYIITSDKLDEGKNILRHVKNVRLKIELYVIILMAKKMLNKIMKLGNDIMDIRPIF